jgi:hypothetical protein
MAVPCLDSHFNNSEKHAERSQKSFRALPVLFVAFHAAFELNDASAVSVAQYSVLVVPSLM